ncbi:hypothetical protein ACC848_45235, partial [Rhizobium johnstonii]
LAAFVLVLAFGVDIPDGSLGSLEQSLVPTAEIVRPVFNLAGLISISLTGAKQRPISTPASIELASGAGMAATARPSG